MIIEKNVERARQMLKKEQSPKIVLAQNEEFNRKMLEYGKFDILLSVELSAGKNKIRQTDSGLNHVLAKIASKNKIAIGINLDNISKMNKKEKAQVLAKIKQNIKICRKAKTKISITCSNILEAKFLLASLGASTQQITEAIVF